MVCFYSEMEKIMRVIRNLALTKGRPLLFKDKGVTIPEINLLCS